MTEKDEAREAARIERVPNEPAILITEADGVETAIRLNETTQAQLLQASLSLLSSPMAHQRSSLLAQKISFQPGRHGDECAVRVFLGRMELTFLVPLEEVLSASAALARELDPGVDADEIDSVN
jgi:hypothetical protein